MHVCGGKWEWECRGDGEVALESTKPNAVSHSTRHTCTITLQTNQKTSNLYIHSFLLALKRKKGHKQAKQSAVSVHSVHYRKSETWCDIELVLLEFL